MQLLNEKIQLSNQATKSNIKLPFKVPNVFNHLKITFEYGPKLSSDRAAQEQIAEAIENYLFPESPAEDYIVENYLPVENFITISLSKDRSYLGGHHNKAGRQEIIISKDSASLGFWPTEITPAEWELQMNCHCIASETLTATIRIEGIN